METSVKPGVITTEFWITLLVPVCALVTLVFHRDYSGYVQAAAAAAAAVSTAIYVVMRSSVKKAAITSTGAASTSNNTVVISGEHAAK